jgi:hypothetical protein
MCIFEKSEDEKENEAYIQQLKELILHFSYLKTPHARKLIIKMVKDWEERENIIKN